MKLCLVAGARDAEGVGFLEGVAADELGVHLAGDGDDGDGIHHGVDQAGDQVGGAGAGSGAADADLAGGARIAFGGEAGVLFVAHEDVADVAVVEGVVKRQGDAAGIAEEAVDAFARQAFEQDFRAVHQFAGFGLHNSMTPDKISNQNKKAIRRVVHPADGLGSFRLPEASDGDGYDDPDNNDAYYREGRGNSACEAGEHCQKLQFMGKVFEMQVRVCINDIYGCIDWDDGVRRPAGGEWARGRGLGWLLIPKRSGCLATLRIFPMLGSLRLEIYSFCWTCALLKKKWSGNA